jgi:hypothetical protein
MEKQTEIEKLIETLPDDAEILVQHTFNRDEDGKATTAPLRSDARCRPQALAAAVSTKEADGLIGFVLKLIRFALTDNVAGFEIRQVWSGKTGDVYFIKAVDKY